MSALPAKEAALYLASGPELWSAVKTWAHESLSPVRFSEQANVLEGTLLIRTGGSWDSILAFADHHDAVLSPLVLLKNPVPLWQRTGVLADLKDGPIPRSLWPKLARVVLIHNPGLGGFLEQVLPGTRELPQR